MQHRQLQILPTPTLHLIVEEVQFPPVTNNDDEDDSIEDSSNKETVQAKNTTHKYKTILRIKVNIPVEPGKNMYKACKEEVASIFPLLHKVDSSCIIRTYRQGRLPALESEQDVLDIPSREVFHEYFDSFLICQYGSWHEGGLVLLHNQEWGHIIHELDPSFRAKQMGLYLKELQSTAPMTNIGWLFRSPRNIPLVALANELSNIAGFKIALGDAVISHEERSTGPLPTNERNFAHAIHVFVEDKLVSEARTFMSETYPSGEVLELIPHGFPYGIYPSCKSDVQ